MILDKLYLITVCAEGSLALLWGHTHSSHFKVPGRRALTGAFQVEAVQGFKSFSTIHCLVHFSLGLFSLELIFVFVFLNFGPSNRLLMSSEAGSIFSSKATEKDSH